MISSALVVGVLLAEAGLRLLDLAPTDAVYTVTQGEFTRIPGIFQPHLHVIDKDRPALAHEVQVNSLGYRGDEIPLDKRQDEVRIFYVGDSFTYGHYVNQGETAPELLENLLRESCPSISVINGGVPGSTIVAHVAMTARARPLEPDLVILQFSENDVADLRRTPIWEQLAQNRVAKSRFPLSIVYPILRGTALWNLALRARASISARTPPATARADAVDASTRRAADDAFRDRYRHGLLALKDTVAALGSHLIVTAFPSHLTVYGDSARSEQLRWLEGLTQAADAPYIDLLGPLKKAGLPDTVLYLLPRDGHASAAGYRVAATALAEAILEHGWLRPDCTRSP